MSAPSDPRAAGAIDWTARVEARVREQHRDDDGLLRGLGYGTGGRVEALVAEALVARERGDVTAEGEAIRTLDTITGHWADGEFRGGAWLLARGT